MERTFTISQKVVRLSGDGVPYRDEDGAPVNDRATRIPGYKADVLRRLSILVVGCGGLGGEIAHGLVRDGVGELILCDHDVVELSNLNRQRFYAHDLYKSKAIQLSRNLIQEAVQPVKITGVAIRVQEAFQSNKIEQVDAIICGVDNDETRIYVARQAINRRIPAIFTGVNVTADYGYVFVQTSRPKDPCFGCLFPDSVKGKGIAPCDVGATISILKTVAGPVIYALSALFMPELMFRWHYKEIFLSGAGQDGNREIVQRVDCQICH